MSVLINFKICDNVPECGGIEVCSSGALFWDKKNKRIGIDNSKCISCKKCESACPVGAIRVASTEERYNKIKQEIDEDERKISDLFVDRYGSMPIDPSTLLKESDFKKIISSSTKPTLVELFKDETLQCLRKSIPIRELMPGKDIMFKKIKIKEDKIPKEFGINEIPCLLFFRDGKLDGKLEGYYGTENENEFKKKIQEMIKK
jgi:Fe-S-cluster-containing hydrogenase component 2